MRLNARIAISMVTKHRSAIAQETSQLPRRVPAGPGEEKRPMEIPNKKSKMKEHVIQLCSIQARNRLMQ